MLSVFVGKQVIEKQFLSVFRSDRGNIVNQNRDISQMFLSQEMKESNLKE